MTDVAAKSIAEPTITRVAARALVEAAMSAAEENAVKAAVAVTDGAGHLIAFERSDGARFLAVDVAIDKAWTAAASGMTTHLWNAVLSGEPKVAPLSQHPRLLGVGGGHPIVEAGRVIGGIGISGGSHMQDQDIAERALAAVGFDKQS